MEVEEPACRPVAAHLEPVPTGEKHLIRPPRHQPARNKHQQGSLAVGPGEELYDRQWAGRRREAGVNLFAGPTSPPMNSPISHSSIT